MENQEKNYKVVRCDIQIPHNESLEQIFAAIKGYDAEMWDKRKSGILKIELNRVEEETKTGIKMQITN